MDKSQTTNENDPYHIYILYQKMMEMLIEEGRHAPDNKPQTMKCKRCEATKNSPYSPALVRKIKKAMKGPFTKVPSDPEGFMKWLISKR